MATCQCCEATFDLNLFVIVLWFQKCKTHAIIGSYVIASICRIWENAGIWAYIYGFPFEPGSKQIESGNLARELQRIWMNLCYTRNDTPKQNYAAVKNEAIPAVWKIGCLMVIWSIKNAENLFLCSDPQQKLPLWGQSSWKWFQFVTPWRPSVSILLFLFIFFHIFH